jgi:putative membrane protein
MFDGFHMGGGWFWLILILVIIFVGFLLWQTYNRNNAGSQRHNEKPKGRSKTAREIADERYANGDISREEYNTIIDDLERDHAAG